MFKGTSFKSYCWYAIRDCGIGSADLVESVRTLHCDNLMADVVIMSVR